MRSEVAHPAIPCAPRHGARLRALSALMLCVALAACGGSDDDLAPSPAPGTPAPGAPAPAPAPGAPAPAPLASGVAALEGEWVNRKVCAPLGPQQSAYQMVKIVRQSDTVVDYRSGTLLYNSANCQGAGSALASSMGTVTLSRMESSAAIAAHWAVWRTITGATAYVVWAKPSDNTLCILGDENPSILPTIDRVAQSAAVQDQQNACFVKL